VGKQKKTFMHGCLSSRYWSRILRFGGGAHSRWTDMMDEFSEDLLKSWSSSGCSLFQSTRSICIVLVTAALITRCSSVGTASWTLLTRTLRSARRLLVLLVSVIKSTQQEKKKNTLPSIRNTAGGSSTFKELCRVLGQVAELLEGCRKNNKTKKIKNSQKGEKRKEKKQA